MASRIKVAPNLELRVLAAPMLLIVLATASCASDERAPVPQEQHQTNAVMQLTVPDAGWHWQVERILEREDAVWIFTKLQRGSGMSAQMITTLELALPDGIALPAKPRRVFVMGKTWAWKNDEPYEFVANFDGLVEKAGAARQRYPLRR